MLRVTRSLECKRVDGEDSTSESPSRCDRWFQWAERFSEDLEAPAEIAPGSLIAKPIWWRQHQTGAKPLGQLYRSCESLPFEEELSRGRRL